VTTPSVPSNDQLTTTLEMNLAKQVSGTPSSPDVFSAALDQYNLAIALNAVANDEQLPPEPQSLGGGGSTAVGQTDDNASDSVS
jgi:hypothetical protein